jgi:hypothetical protein
MGRPCGKLKPFRGTFVKPGGIIPYRPVAPMPDVLNNPPYLRIDGASPTRLHGGIRLNSQALPIAVKFRSADDPHAGIVPDGKITGNPRVSVTF